LINIGAYPAGSNAAIDRAIQLHEPLRGFLRQGVQEGFSARASWELLGKAMAVAVPSKPVSSTPPPPPKRP
jgi:flagellum-specific ATP synthase